MRQPVMTALLLIMCFPVKGVVVTYRGCIIGGGDSLPKAPVPTKPQRSAHREGEHASRGKRPGAREETPCEKP